MRIWLLTGAVGLGLALPASPAPVGAPPSEHGYVVIRFIMGGTSDKEKVPSEGTPPGVTPPPPKGGGFGPPKGGAQPSAAPSRPPTPRPPTYPPGTRPPTPRPPRPNQPPPKLPPPKPGTTPSDGLGEVVSEEHTVTAVVEVHNWFNLIPLGWPTGPTAPRVPPSVMVPAISHKYLSDREGAKEGYTRLYNDNASLQVARIPVATVHNRFQSRLKNQALHYSADRILDDADWALAHGLVTECGQQMDKLVEEVGKGKLKATSESIKAAVEAYRKVKADLDKPVGEPAERKKQIDSLRDKFGPRMSSSDHYALVYNSSLSDPPEVLARLQMMEENYRAFFYWFAIKGKALPVPDYRLSAVVFENPEDFYKQQDALEEPLSSDEGLLYRRENVAFYSAQRLDEASRQFASLMQAQVVSGWEKQDLFNKFPKQKKALPPPGHTPQEFTLSNSETARMSTLVLLERALNEEAMRAAVTHEGTRQLVAAVGLTPRNVEVPQWLQFGMPAFMETPKGPFPAAPASAKVAYWHGTGGPSWAYLRQYQDWASAKKLDLPGEALRKVVTDQYFRDAASSALRPILQGGFGLGGLPAPPPPGTTPVAPPGVTPGTPPIGTFDPYKEHRDRLLKAKTMSWALTYYLARQKLPGLLAYYQELGTLPRDLELDESMTKHAFAKAFDLLNSDRTAIDAKKWDDFARTWADFMPLEHAPGVEIAIDKPKPPSTETTPTPPTGPGVPGVPPGTPGVPPRPPGTPGLPPRPPRGG